ncbi:hypothetical protein M514_12298 [Trichuris suis]|uniref:Uncharacterized protein n=1 Tax=Trichuris suis TaxID=68888 RepID=A0A085MXA4_9BILA|nr:hypothetical protein M513_12298 [Trichuris suis]KFD61850.1 hypothetical protein M514_12298 [Trichuris suis]
MYGFPVYPVHGIHTSLILMDFWTYINANKTEAVTTKLLKQLHVTSLTSLHEMTHRNNDLITFSGT